MNVTQYSWQRLVLLLALVSSLFLGVGCAGRERYAGMDQESTTIERPAVPLSEEETLADKIGQAGVAVLVVAAAIGGILVPILFLL